MSTLTAIEQQIVTFIRNNAQYGGVAIKSHGYVPAVLGPEWINDKTDEGIIEYMRAEITTFDRHKNAIACGASVTVYIIQVQTYNVMHLQAYSGDGGLIRFAHNR